MMGDLTPLHALLRGRSCHLLGATPAAAADIRLRLARQLDARGIGSVTLNLGRISARSSPEGLYYALGSQLAAGLGLALPTECWRRNEERTAPERFALYLRTEVLPNLPGPLVLFIEPFEALRLAPGDAGADEFLAAVRPLLERPFAAGRPRLIFCLVGTEPLGDLLKAPAQLPLDLFQVVDRAEPAAAPAPPPPDPTTTGPPAPRPPPEQAPRSGPLARALLAPALLLCAAAGNFFIDRSHRGEADAHAVRTEIAALRAAEQRGEKAELVARHAFRQLARCADPRPGAAAAAEQALAAALRSPGPATEALALIDGLATMALARFPAGRAEALRSGAQLLDADLRARRPPRAETQRGLYLAVMDSLMERSPPADPTLWPVLRGHPGAVRAVQFSPDGQRLASADNQGGVALWDARSGRLLARLRGHSDLVRALSFSPDGTQLVTASNDRTARIFSVSGSAPGECRAVLQGHGAEVLWAAFSPDGARVFSAGGEGVVRVWDAHGGTPILLIPAHAQGILAAALAPDGSLLVTASADQSARLWDAHTGASGPVLRGHAGPVRVALFSPDGRTLLTAGADRSARLWDRSGAQRLLLGGHAQEIGAAAFSADGKRVVTASVDRTARLYDTASGALLATLAGHTAALGAVAFSPDGTLIATGSADRTARLWDLRGGPLVTLRGHALGLLALAFSPDSQHLVTAGWDRTLRVHPASPQAFLDIACQLVRGVAEPEPEPGAMSCAGPPALPELRR